eukprot:5106975-Amphidinium_carterae.1
MQSNDGDAQPDAKRPKVDQNGNDMELVQTSLLSSTSPSVLQWRRLHELRLPMLMMMMMKKKKKKEEEKIQKIRREKRRTRQTIPGWRTSCAGHHTLASQEHKPALVPVRSGDDLKLTRCAAYSVAMVPRVQK